MAVPQNYGDTMPIEIAERVVALLFDDNEPDAEPQSEAS